MSTVDRLIDGINGEDPAGARFYMAQLRQNEVRCSLVSIFGLQLVPSAGTFVFK